MYKSWDEGATWYFAAQHSAVVLSYQSLFKSSSECHDLVLLQAGTRQHALLRLEVIQLQVSQLVPLQSGALRHFRWKFQRFDMSNFASWPLLLESNEIWITGRLQGQRNNLEIRWHFILYFLESSSVPSALTVPVWLPFWLPWNSVIVSLASSPKEVRIHSKNTWT